MRALISVVLATTLLASSALADDGALAPGKPAGVQQAQMTQNELWIALGVTAIAAGIVIAATSQSHTQAAAAGGGGSTTTTTTTSTSP
jgi:hypothetical protein